MTVPTQDNFYPHLVRIISETNGIGLNDTLHLLLSAQRIKENPALSVQLEEFIKLLAQFHLGRCDIHDLLKHPVSLAFFQFFNHFPLRYHEEHIHLTGSLDANFIFPLLQNLLQGPQGDEYAQKIEQVYGVNLGQQKNLTVEKLQQLISLQKGQSFSDYLKILLIPKMVLGNRDTHSAAAYHMASNLYQNFHVGKIRLKFTLSRANALSSEQIPRDNGQQLTEEDVILGLYDGFRSFQEAHPDFNFSLSPCFRKEGLFYDAKRFASKQEDFTYQVSTLLEILDKYPFLSSVMNEVDTVGDERELYRKKHFEELKQGFRRLQYRGFRVRSHHGENWFTLRKGVQSVDNAMNIWRIDALKHGISLGINPNYYFHRLYQQVMEWNNRQKAIPQGSPEFYEIDEMDWANPQIKNKLFTGNRLNNEDVVEFIKTKYHMALEVETYQHDVLNRMLSKEVELIALPSSNLKLTGRFPHYKDHPFSWWEKKGAHLGVGTDNYVTLNTNYLQELLILLYSDPENLKITKLLMVATQEKRRPYIGHLLWEMNKKLGNI